MKSFDEILKEGKDKAKSVPNVSKKWRESINVLMSALHTLNDFYGEKQHYIKISQAKCTQCHKTSYVIILRDINDLQRSVRYHRGGWKPIDKDTYFCDVCK